MQNRVPGEPFVAKPAKDAEMEKILRSMEVLIYTRFIHFQLFVCAIGYLKDLVMLGYARSTS